MPAEGEPIVGEERLGLLVGHRRPLELDEEDLVADRGAALLGAGHERTRDRVGGVDRELQPCVGTGASGQLTDRRQLAHQLGQALGVELADPAAV